MMPEWWIPRLDTWIVLVGALSAMSCALLGNFLVLRRMSMMGDALSHAVLPGIVVAFAFSGSRDNLPMFIGALLVGMLTAMMISVVRRSGRLDEGASMGVVFTIFFALGIVLIERLASARHLDLDPKCVLYGSLETVPLQTIPGWELFGLAVPAAFVSNLALLLLNALFVGVFYKELKITSFDPAMASAQGISPGVMHYALMSLVAATCVLAFWTVGSIIVIAMLIVPGAAALLITKRLGLMMVISLVFAAVCAVVGHWGAVEIPARFGLDATNTSGMMATVAGLLFAGCLVVSLLRRRRDTRRLIAPAEVATSGSP